jgi:8-oxo-dGTP diphosphatase
MDKLPSTYYRVSAKALILDADKKLLVFRDKNGEWEVPGGGWEHDESFEACLARELAEEVQAKVASVGSIVFCYRGATRRGSPKICVAAWVELGSHHFVPSGDDLVEARFVAKVELLQLPFQDGEETIKDYVDQIWPRKSDVAL